MAINTKATNHGSKGARSRKKATVNNQETPTSPPVDALHRLNLAEFHHLALLQDGDGDDGFEDHRKLVAKSSVDCAFCASGAPNDAVRAYLFEEDLSLLTEFLAAKP